VEGPHRQLGAGFADGLGGNDADRFTDVHQRAAGQVAAVAHGADAFFGFAGQRAADADLHARAVDQVGTAFVDQLAPCDDQTSPGCGGCTSSAATRPRTRSPSGTITSPSLTAAEAVIAFGAAIMDADDAVLRHVDQTAGQIARVRRLERGIGQTLPGAVGRVEVFKNGQTFLEVRDDRRFDDLARRLGHQAAHPAKLLHLDDRTPGTRVGHHIDRVRLRSGPFGVHRGGQPRWCPSSPR
jgi:hypothetical protein